MGRGGNLSSFEGQGEDTKGKTERTLDPRAEWGLEDIGQMNHGAFPDIRVSERLGDPDITDGARENGERRESESPYTETG